MNISEIKPICRAMWFQKVPYQNARAHLPYHFAPIRRNPAYAAAGWRHSLTGLIGSAIGTYALQAAAMTYPP